MIISGYALIVKAAKTCNEFKHSYQHQVKHFHFVKAFLLAFKLLKVLLVGIY